MHWIWLRLGAATVGLSGVGAGFAVNVDRATRQGQDLGLVLTNYFSMFTIVTTIFTAIALAAAAIWSVQHPGSSREPLGIALGLAIVTGPMLLLGVVFNVLLRGDPSAEALADSPGIALLDSYATEVLHVVVPLYLLVDLLLATRRRGLRWWTLSVLIAYPLIWIVYTMVRGEFTPDPTGATAWWYPYFFLNPHDDGGWVSAITYIVVLLGALVAVGAAVIAVGRFRERRAATREDAEPAESVLQA